MLFTFFLLFTFLLFYSFVLIVDIICIDHITSYLYINVRPIFHIYSYIVNAWCITSFPVCNLICFSVPYSFHLVRFTSYYKLNPNSIHIYVSPFLLQQMLVFLFRLNLDLHVVLTCCINVFMLYVCCMMGFIAMLYKCVCVVLVLYDVMYACCFLMFFLCCMFCVVF